MTKDRAAPFSRKHRRTWIPVTGGMILIGVVNLIVGMYLYANRPVSAPPTSAQPFVDAGPLDAGPVDGRSPSP